jgi:hypothetical protein
MEIMRMARRVLCVAQSPKPEKAKLVIAVGGKRGMIHLPLSVAVIFVEGGLLKWNTGTV